MRFKTLAGVQLAAGGVGLGAAVIAALSGADYWSLVIQRLGWTLALTGGAWLTCRWRPGAPRRHQGLRSLLGYGGNITRANLTNFATRNLHMVLIVWWWCPVLLALSARSTTLLMTPPTNLNHPLLRCPITTPPPPPH